MPGNVGNAAPADVLPSSLSVAFSQSRLWAIPENVYQNGESQRRQLVTTSRKSWTLSKRLTATDLSELYTFFQAHKAAAFYFYDGQETSPKWSYDETGVAATGRYTVRFDQTSWEQSILLGRRGQVEIRLVEVT